jgi:hypothetical protein
VAGFHSLAILDRHSRKGILRKFLLIMHFEHRCSCGLVIAVDLRIMCSSTKWQIRCKSEQAGCLKQSYDRRENVSRANTSVKNSPDDTFRS